MQCRLSFFVQAGALACALATSLVAQTPIDLRTWSPETYGAPSSANWTPSATGDSVFQSINGAPTFFVSPVDLASGTVEGELSVSASDDDFIGFAIGFRPGDTTNPAADYLLLDWKRITQYYNHGCTPGSTARRGIALSRVRGIPAYNEFWGHVNLDTVSCSTASDSVTELARGITTTDVGWAHRAVYSFRIDFTPTRVRVTLDSVLQIDVSGSFRIGRFAFYNFSQANVTYRAYTSSCIAASSNYGIGHAGTLGIPSLTSSAAPVLGTSIDLLVGNSAGAATLGALMFGYEDVSIPSGLGGDILTLPLLTISLPISNVGASVPLAVPNDPFFCGGILYLQSVQLDSGASHGLSFSPGLELVGGN